MDTDAAQIAWTHFGKKQRQVLNDEQLINHKSYIINSFQKDERNYIWDWLINVGNVKSNGISWLLFRNVFISC